MAKKESTEATGFVNPFEPATYEVVDGLTKIIPGPSIAEFITALGSSTVADYVKGQLIELPSGELKEFDENDISYLESEIKKHAYNVKNKDRFLAQAQKDHYNLVMKNEKKAEY